MKNQTHSTKWLAIALALCLIGAWVAGMIQNSFGRVSITDVVIETDTGGFTGYLLKPKTASASHPAPAIVTSHGYLNNREMQDINYVELSRRGYVVFAMDAYGHGDSSVAVEGRGSEISKQTGGMVDAVEYLHSLDFVDKERIGVTGHSMGGGFADATASYYTKLEKEALADGITPTEAAALNKVAAALIIGNVPMGLNENAPYLTELGIIAGRYDEFFIITLQDSVVDIFSNTIAAELFSLQQGVEVVITDGEMIEGQRYVNQETGFGIAMWSPWEIHPWNHFSTTTVGHTIDFFQAHLGAPNPIPSGNQVWWLKEAFNLVGLVGFFLMIIPLADLLMNLSFFAPLKPQEPVAEVELPARKGRAIGASLFNSLMGAVLIIPLIAVGFLMMVNRFWPQDTTGGIGLWAAGSGLISLLAIRIGGTRFSNKGKEMGIKISAKTLFRTALLAIILASVLFLTVFMADWIFKTDFRIWTFAVRTFSAAKVWVAIKYLPFFLVFFLANSLAVSRNRFSGWSKGKQIVVSIGWNILGVILFIALQYVPLMINGMTFWGAILSGPLAMAGSLFPILVFPFVPILAIAAVIGVRLYDRTGNIYLAGFVNALVITMLTVANTSFSFPY
jgi:pimeloyl-ACP methyl ester carboxylesterase